MRITIDMSAAVNQGAGIGRYARHLIPAAAAVLPEASFALWYAPEPEAGARFVDQTRQAMGATGRVSNYPCRFDRRRMDQLWFRARLPVPIELWTGRSDLIYSPDFTAPPAIGTPSIVTIHDLAYEIVPERAPAALRKYLSTVVPRQVRRAAAVVTVSETTKRDVIERLGVSGERIRVIPNAADERFFAAKPLSEDERARLGLPARYFLTVGTLEPRKNHLALFDALARLPKSSTPPLAVAGRVGWNADAILRRAQELAAEGRVILLDYVDDRLLPGLYAGAVAVAYPSWYEGFGLPVLEGLAAGTPVIASRVPAHVEVAGEEARYVDPANVDSIAAALRATAAGEGAAAGDAARRRERAGRYAWQESGRELAELMRAMANR